MDGATRLKTRDVRLGSFVVYVAIRLLAQGTELERRGNGQENRHARRGMVVWCGMEVVFVDWVVFTWGQASLVPSMKTPPPPPTKSPRILRGLFHRQFPESAWRHPVSCDAQADKGKSEPDRVTTKGFPGCTRHPPAFVLKVWFWWMRELSNSERHPAALPTLISAAFFLAEAPRCCSAPAEVCGLAARHP